jgi:hypothetical protein
VSTTFNRSLFVDVADALGLGNAAIVEKDYYVVQLLQQIASLELRYHQIVFSGGTALAKSSIKTFRMSEDIDLKMVPKSDCRVQQRQSRELLRPPATHIALINREICFDYSKFPAFLKLFPKHIQASHRAKLQVFPSSTRLDRTT